MTMAVSVHTCLLRRFPSLGRAGQNRAEQEKWWCLCPLMFVDRFCKAVWKAAPRLEVSMQSGPLASAWPEDVFSVPGPWLSSSPSFLTVASHCGKAVVKGGPRRMSLAGTHMVQWVPGQPNSQGWMVWKQPLSHSSYFGR